MKRSRIPLITMVFLLIFFYLPIVVLVVNSFNDSRSGSVWGGFTLKWYARLVSDVYIQRAFRNTLMIAAVATVAATVLGAGAAMALHYFQSRLQKVHYLMIYSPLVVPDILMGISLLLFFGAVKMSLGQQTIMLAHTTFCISYVALVVLARLQDFDYSLIEAARDLGASKRQAIRRVLLPLLAPGILAGAALAFTLSIDDFVITFFVAGPGSTTLPIYIYSMIRHGRPLVINALSTILLVVTFTIVWFSQRVTLSKSEGD